MNLRPLIAASFAYFGLVFAAGFALGTLRVLLIVPLVGEGKAEILEMPLMLAISFLAAGFVLKRFTVAGMLGTSFVGLLALTLLLATELTVVLQFRGMNFRQYVDSRDPLALTVYAIGLLAFAAMPSIRQCLRPRFAGKGEDSN